MDTTGSNKLSNTTDRRYYIDFDEWSRLADNDPDTFEIKRKSLLDDFLSQFSEHRQRRLRGLQFQIDMERRRAKTPMAACIRLSDMMWESVDGKNGLRETVNQLRSGQISVRAHPTSTKASIIPFPGSQNKPG